MFIINTYINTLLQEYNDNIKYFFIFWNLKTYLFSILEEGEWVGFPNLSIKRDD